MRRLLIGVIMSMVGTTFVPFAAHAGEAPPPIGWINTCTFAHRQMDDPIVFPGEPGAAHNHDFYGNETTDAYSTPASLLRGTTTCDLEADKAAYWLPTLYVGEEMISTRENEVDFYYRSRTYPLSAVRPFPRGLKIVAGAAHATGPQGTRTVDWDCEDGGSDQDLNHPVDCGTGYVSADIKFPDCWDGQHRDSKNHKRHMAYSIDPDDDGRFTCPRGHPVPVPRLIFSVEWQVHDGTAITLSSGPYFTLHADFFNSWRQGRLRALVNECIHAGTNCGHVEVPV
jgi:hypothetical protein